MMSNRSLASRSSQTTRTGKRPMNSGSNPYSMKSFVVTCWNKSLSMTSTGCALNPTRDLFFQFLERTANDEQNVAGVDRVAFGFAAPLKFERRLQLSLEIIHAAYW